MMRHFTLTIFSIIFASILMIGCKFSHSEPATKVDDSSKSSNLMIAKTSLRFVQEAKTDSLKGLFNSKVARKIKPEQLDWIIAEGKKVLDNSIYPNDTSILKSQKTNYSATGKQVIELFSFPFQSKFNSDSVKYFHITVVDNEIHRFFLNDYPPGMRIIEPKHNEPHIENLNMQTDNIKWFRIWYDDGAMINKRYGNNTGYYAVSGDKDKLNEIGVKDQFQKMLELINAAEFDSLDFKYMREKEQGDPEWIYLRFRFDNEEYRKLKEFEISYYIKEQPGKKEILSDYIVFKHTDKTRYLLSKTNNPELVKILTDLAHRDYRKNLERYP